MIKERIQALRSLMLKRGIDCYLVPTADYHQSEYVGEYFKLRAFLSGFTGSAGTLVVTRKEAALWTDGRYFVQAAKELEGSGILLMKMGEEGVPTTEEYIEKNIPKDGCLGFDGRTVSAALGKKLEQCIKSKHGIIAWEEELGDTVWADRPRLSCEPIYRLEECYAGKSRKGKIEELRMEMEQRGAAVHILASLDDIAWLLNLRGNDIVYNPVFLSYAAVTKDKFVLFVQREAVEESLRRELEEDGITCQSYFSVYQYADRLAAKEAILLDEETVNYAIYQAVTGRFCRIIDDRNPTALKKAVKNETEIRNLKTAHIKDAVALCRFLYWLSERVGKERITELDAAAYIEKLRREDPDCLGLSFSTIAAYGANAAMCHYSPTEESDTEIRPEGFFLLDSGGQYWQGTTDITRTVAVGPLTREQKKHFTLVLKGNIRLAKARFRYGCCGANLDYLARGPLWECGLDYNHGTGHGVGYLLNVHEGPNSIRWKISSVPGENAVLEEGMLTSDEPGFYAEGKYGIRTENLLLCRKAEKTEYGQFMEFEPVTLVPIDTTAVIPEMMREKEIQWLNEYHERVYQTIGPLLLEKEREWLRKATLPLKKEV